MNHISKIKRLSFFLFAVLFGFLLIGQFLGMYCPKQPREVETDSIININNLYPWPDSKIPFACHIRDLLKSPFAPRDIYATEMVFKEEGYPILTSRRREGVVSANISFAGELLPMFFEPMRSNKTPLFVQSTSLYVDGQQLQAGHIGYRELDFEFNFASILTPFLLPGEHTGKVVLQLPTGEILEYEWHFQITWW